MYPWKRVSEIQSIKDIHGVMSKLWLGVFAVKPIYSIDAQSGKKGWSTQHECIRGEKEIIL